MNSQEKMIWNWVQAGACLWDMAAWMHLSIYEVDHLYSEAKRKKDRERSLKEWRELDHLQVS